MGYLLINLLLLILSPVLCPGGQNTVVLSQSAQLDASLEKLAPEIHSDGGYVVSIPAEEADIAQAGLLSSGGPVVVVDPGERGGYKVYDGATGADITSKFKAGIAVKEEPRPVAAPIPELAKSRKTPAPQPKAKPTFERNHIGLAAGMTNLEKNEDSLDMLATNPNAEANYTKTTGRFRLFFEHYFSEKYGLGLAVGAQKGAQSMLDLPNRTLEIEGDPKSATLYVIRRFGRHFGVYLGGGVDLTAITLDDPSNLAGVPSGAGAFEGQITAPHAEAGLIFSAGNFSLRFSLKETMGEGTDELTRGANGPKYLLITRNNNSVSYKYSGQTLAANEEYFKVDMGGFASAVTLNYAFGNW
jgi:hypothetical protein